MSFLKTALLMEENAMSLFDRFKKRNTPTEAELSKSVNEFEQIWNMDIAEIWNISNRNSFVIAMSGWLNRKCQYGEKISALSPEEKTAYIVDSFQSEVNNGGFSQYLYNSSGASVSELLAALSVVGADRTAEIYRKALEYLPAKLPLNNEQRGAVLDEFITDEISAVLASCDDQFYEYPDDLETLIYQFIMDNKNSFT